MITIAIDPGLRAQGVAVFRDQTLIAAALVRVPGKERGPAQWQKVAEDTFLWVDSLGLPLLREVASEYPQSYIAALKKSASDEDLIELAGVVGATTSMLSRQVTGYLPAAWKGQVPKDIMVARILARLSPDEKALYDELDVPASLKHNCADAVGVGLFHLGRLERKRAL